MKRIIISLIITYISISLYAEGLDGVVYEKNEQGEKLALVGVNVYWLGTTKGTFTDNDGKFHLNRSGIKDPRLVISLLGYGRDTLTIPRDKSWIEVEMVPNQQELGEVEIKSRRDNTYTLRLSPRQTTVITTGELQRAACCNLAESFETNASIDVTYSDAVSGARQIQLLGLSGNYSQIMTENVPMIRGMAVTYGLNYIPGPWMESIQVSKGASSVTNGFEAITGQINVDYKKPATSEKFYFNAFVNSNLRLEANANGSIKINDKLSTLVALHVDDYRNTFDRNDDGFMDIPKLTTLNFFNRWDFINDGKFVSRLGIKYLDERRRGGQTDFNADEFTFDTTGISEQTKTYGIDIKTKRAEAFWKNGVIFGESSIGLILYGVHHDQESYFGINKYSGLEQSLYANLVFATHLAGEEHKLSAGINYMLDSYEENYLQHLLTYEYQVTGDTANGALFRLVGDSLADHDLNRSYSIPGAYAEYTFDKEKFTMVLGMRTDYLDNFGWNYAPRLNLRYAINESTTLRGSAGKGYRLANILPENSPVFVSQRTLYIANDLQPEVGWNYGLSFVKTFKWLKHKSEFSLDLYRTDFVNQVIADMDSIPTAVYFYNLDGKSYSNSIQAQLIFARHTAFPLPWPSAITDVKMTTNGKLQERQMISRYKGLVSLAYATKFDKWKFDVTCQVNGPQRLPDTEKMPEFLQRPGYSPTFVNLLAQITKKFKYVDVYLGGENLTNFRQKDPISEYWAPYHTHFDGSMSWGPITGISVYAGVRVTIK